MFYHNILILALITTFLQAQKTYTFSGIHDNTMHKSNAAVLSVAYANIGIDTKFIFQPGERSLRDSNRGIIDGEAGRIKKITKHYPNLVQVPVQLNQVEGAVFCKNKNLKIKDWESLRPYSIVIVRGAKFIEKKTEGMNRTIVENFETAFKFLDKNRADILVAPYQVGNAILHQLQINAIYHIKPKLNHLKVYHFLHKKNRDILPKITAELEKMQRNGDIERLKKAYYKTLGL
jgi:polar amino acid transport system substrate-binding protein